ncbi:MAG: CYTH domain-containing protein [Candidatus Abawacabacteria bacterium]|nr:CYTH domain-containing protein [Candidatus Abawacabacteria bacterium]
MIEVELRSFLNEEQYQALLSYFQEHGQFVNEEEQETHYFDCDQDLRIQKSTKGAKVWLKKGNMHDAAREEIEIKVPADDFANLAKLFAALNYGVKVKWLRKRYTFSWQGVSVMLDYTKGYGWIIELEKLVTEGQEVIAHEELQEKLKILNISVSSKEEFEDRYQYYLANWQHLIAD